MDWAPPPTIRWAARRLAYGPAPGEDGLPLLADGITHVLNIGESPSPKATGLAVVERLFPDLVRIPDDVAVACLEDVHRWLADPGARVLVHCVMGQHRSPTIVWLYMIALGMDPSAARRRVEAVWQRAIPGHPLLVDPALVERVTNHGEAVFRSTAADDALALPDPIGY